MSETPAVRRADEQHIYDVLGIGFGPANLALAVALEEQAERKGGRDLERLFLEARERPSWHPGMLIEDSLIQITVLKDLITVCNPRSRFTFLNYLKEKDRLFEFLNVRDLFPSRVEFNDYLSWAAEQLAHRVRYGHRVSAVEPVEDGGDVDLLRVRVERVADGGEEVLLARNVVVATGGRPWLPDGIELPGGDLADRVFHAYDFMQRMDRGFPDRQGSHRFVVIGGGQSGAELFYTLLKRYPNADVTATVRRYGYKPVDESDFTNEVFFPEMTDFVYNLPGDKRREVIDSFRDVNYATVDHPLIQKIYRHLYDERVAGKDRGRLLPYLELEAIDTAGDDVRLRFRHVIEDRPVELECDGVILATGFTWTREEHPLLKKGLAPCFERDGDDRFRVLRDYRLAGRDGFDAGVYLQGYCEDTHGISETVLSLVAVRAREIADSLTARVGDAETVPEPQVVGAARDA
ncbi:MAG: SidA/IucD/PvdA family monooxygenase [Acidobacteriota bacterium]|jgi:L-ornithine N5-oxygenase